jgi:predicted CoA-substrate-specific enzyme activase
MKNIYLGIDVGSVTTKCAVLDEDLELVTDRYRLTSGRPIVQIQELLREVRAAVSPDMAVAGVGTTGSARYLAGVVVGADIVKNEITTHAAAATHYLPEVNTVIEIGGQDSKIIIVRNGIVTDFGMNTVCAAGTGSFLDHQALRLGITIEDFSREALESRNPVRIAGRCTVFAESDMIHKQQMGHTTADILYGLCQALVRNYINNVGLGKEIKPPIIFQGGVAFNRAIVKAFSEELEQTVTVLPHHEVMGAIGAALLARENHEMSGETTPFRGFDNSELDYETSTFLCDGCPNKCEIAQLKRGGKVLARWGGRCERWEYLTQDDEDRDMVAVQ